MRLSKPDVFSVSRRTLKHNHLFLVDNPHGFIPYKNDSGFGLYHLDTRFLSCLEIKLNGTLPVPLLSSTQGGAQSTLVYTNGKLGEIPEETLQLKRETVLCDGFYEKITLSNFHSQPVALFLEWSVEADYRDIFEVRHFDHHHFGKHHVPAVSQTPEETQVLFAYTDGVGQVLQTQLFFPPGTEPLQAPAGRMPVNLLYQVDLQPLQVWEFTWSIHPVQGQPSVPSWVKPVSCFETAQSQVQASAHQWLQDITLMESDNQDFNDILTQCQTDLLMLRTEHQGDPFMAAGIPWYTCLFGRDSLITARDCLLLNSQLARETLTILARYQGQNEDPWRDEAPGKIPHELRLGELARLNEIPHTPYYGTVDATPLWIILLHDYYQWTGDRETLESLWPHAKAAMAWIQQSLERSPLGYLTYCTQSTKGLLHQGWKDSQNSAMDELGRLVSPPLALAEVQGYVYLAHRLMADLSGMLEDKTLQQGLKENARLFKAKFHQDFWLPAWDYVPLALDSDGRPLAVVSSNPGHCLETGILSAHRAQKVAERLMASDMFSGWGIRTLSTQAKAYNPMSYHNGSVWPHDTAMVARGFSKIGRTVWAETLFTGLYEAARLTHGKRLPELFCGFPREAEKRDPPVKYPVACSPQAWAASSIYGMLLSILHFVPDLPQNTLRIQHPMLPKWINSLRFQNFRVGESLLDIELKRTNHTVLVDVHQREGDLKIVLEI